MVRVRVSVRSMANVENIPFKYRILKSKHIAFSGGPIVNVFPLLTSIEFRFT